MKKAINSFNKSSPWQKRWQKRESLRLEHIEKKRVSKNEKNQSKLLEEIDNLRLNVSGVSLDEEMVNLIQFQHSYNASAKVISTIDSLLDVVVNSLVR